MPKVGVESVRRESLIKATIEEIGRVGNLNVTVSNIAKRAGVSSGLAFHYFGDKDRLFLSAMRSILTNYSQKVGSALKASDSPETRLENLIRASFAKVNFERNIIAAWLNFYVLAQSSKEARRLLLVYHRRLHSNLTYHLRELIGSEADASARRLAGIIDGLYLRSAIVPSLFDENAAVDEVLAALEIEIKQARAT